MSLQRTNPEMLFSVLCGHSGEDEGQNNLHLETSECIPHFEEQVVLICKWQAFTRIPLLNLFGSRWGCNS